MQNLISQEAKLVSRLCLKNHLQPCTGKKKGGKEWIIDSAQWYNGKILSLFLKQP